MNVAELTSVLRPRILENTTLRQPGNIQKNQEPQKAFKEIVTDFVESADAASKAAAAKVEAVVIGDSDNLHDAMAALEESKLNFQLMMEIRNKLLESFKEVQRMSV